MIRTRFNHQLDELDKEMTYMGMLCETIISRAVHSLFDHDTQAAGSIPELLDQLNQCNKTVDAAATQILLQQQPVASDLRYVSSAMKIVTDMRRIGIQGGDIAEIVSMGTVYNVPEDLGLREMGDSVISMVTESLDAFVHKDSDAALAVIADDDTVDAQFDHVRSALIKTLPESNEKNAEAAIDILMIAKYLERIADHAVHMSRWVCYAVTGKHPEMESV